MHKSITIFTWILLFGINLYAGGHFIPPVTVNAIITNSTYYGNGVGITNVTASNVNANTSPTNYTATSTDVQGNLVGIDAALGEKLSTNGNGVGVTNLSVYLWGAGATGGTITTNGAMIVHTFTNSGTFTPLVSSLNCQVLVVAGGGGGGGNAGGGGGGGGVISNGLYSITSNINVTVGIGGGGGATSSGGIGADAGTNGNNSSFGTNIAYGGGGGGGGSGPTLALNGGSGGGGYGTIGSTTNLGGSPTNGQGFAGGVGVYHAAGGGGGASVIGSSGISNSAAGNGGNGYLSSIKGSSTYYGGGGGGGGITPVIAGTGGLGGGSNGSSNNIAPVSSSNNTGGGGGGGGHASGSGSVGGSGGSGIIIVSYTGGLYVANNLDATVNNLNTNTLPLTGGTMGANINLNGNAISNGTASVTALQVTGGNPTNGAVLVPTNSLGQVGYVVLPKILAHMSSSKNFPSGQFTTVAYDTTDYILGGSFDGINWIPGVVREIGIDTCFFANTKLTGTEQQVVFFKNGVMKKTIYFSSATYMTPPVCFKDFCESATNSYCVKFYTDVSVTNNNSGAQYSYFNGYALP